MNMHGIPFGTTDWMNVDTTHTELKDGRRFTLTPGMSYQVADNEEPHRSSTHIGARLFIVD